MTLDKINRLNDELKKPDKDQYIIADVVYENDMIYLVKVGHNMITIVKAPDVIVHEYERGK